MSETDHVLDFLRENSARVHQRLERIDGRLDEMVSRIGYLERNAAEVECADRRAFGSDGQFRPAVDPL